jgi:tryptophan synthase alpha chain
MPRGSRCPGLALGEKNVLFQSMERLAKTFAQCRAEGRPAFVSYVCAGDPDVPTSKAILLSLAEAGADILEVGVPFSDPLADGLTNQLAAQRALEAGMTYAQLLEIIRQTRAGTDKPIILYCYYNLLYSFGIETYCRQVKEAGGDGLLVLDCPPEEAGELISACQKHGLANIFIIAPTTPPARMALIARHASGFIYYVSREGVTGERAELASNLSAAVKEIKKHTNLPVCVGFGISTAAHVQAVGRIADGVVVGSALVNVVAAHHQNRSAAAAAVGQKVRELLAK